MATEKLKKDLNIVQSLVIPGLDADLDVIAKLDDEPNDVGGLTAAQLKAKFDEAGNIIKEYINETLLPSVSDTVAEAEEREAAEAERAAAEQGRVEAEDGRTAAEQARVEAEAARMTAEQGRENAEAARVQAEQGRVAAEQAREAAEAARANETSGIVAQATVQATAAAGSADAAAASAETAKQYSGKPPIIQNGTWWNWDAEKQEYVDTGDSSGLSQADADARYLSLEGGTMADRADIWFNPKGERYEKNTHLYFDGLLAEDVSKKEGKDYKLYSARYCPYRMELRYHNSETGLAAGVGVDVFDGVPSIYLLDYLSEVDTLRLRFGGNAGKGNPITLRGLKAPTEDNDAANKAYVDSKAGLTQAEADARYLKLTGGSFNLQGIELDIGDSGINIVENKEVSQSNILIFDEDGSMTGFMNGAFITNAVDGSNAALSPNSLTVCGIVIESGMNPGEQSICVSGDTLLFWTGTPQNKGPVELTGIKTPSKDDSAANKSYVDGLIGNINSVLDAINGEVI